MLTPSTNNNMRLKQISISEENYFILKSYGEAGDSFNDVISEMLKTLKKQRTDSGVGAPDQSVATKTHRKDGSGHV
jgi:predicted CopG family antitoxin